ncbi:metalloregulator ArsR/SmtB family transcription factor [uncultured Roseobacter sp.]|uniref:ArsR/SmtB family transcription factor n=1 Tax=uncultured Roseobacter sp. TaxID=114847 RepID=UPI0026239116|nr:metalloregulator ArsR/SmtB family transcription factor [uncultured Roseobacter sp.]
MGTDATFSALAHPVRRQMLDRLLDGPATVSQLGANHGISPGAISQHLRVLEQADMIRRTLNGRQHHIELDERGFQPVLTWAEKYGAFWGANLESLGEFLMREKSDEQ